jgi:hypothetical protein
LCKPLTLSPVPIDAKRRNAQKSAGARPWQGNVQSCVIGRRDGGRSLRDRDLMQALFDAWSSDRSDAIYILAPITTDESHDIYENTGT